MAVVDTDSWGSADILLAAGALRDSLAAVGSDGDNFPADTVPVLVRAIVGTLEHQRTALLELLLDIGQTLAESLLQGLPKWEAWEPASLAMSPEIVDSIGCC